MSRAFRMPLTLPMLCLVLTGCVTINNPGLQIAPLPSAVAPQLISGDLFLYSDGYIEEVIASNVSSTHWSLGYGATQAIKRSEIELPPIEWASENTSYSFAIQNQSRSLWPLSVGNSSQVSATVSVTANNASQQFSEDWTCDVPKSMRLTLQAGQFDTFLIDCSRTSASGAHSQRRRLYYAPSVGHYVRAVEEVRSHSYPTYVFVQRDLMWFRKFSAAKNAENRQAQIQAALNQQPAGTSVTLLDGVGEEQEQMRLDGSFVTKENVFCRQAQFSASTMKSYTATLCNMAGVWRYAEVQL